MPDDRVPMDWFQRRTEEELRDLRTAVANMVPRKEHEQKWKADDIRFESMRENLSDMKKSFEEKFTAITSTLEDISSKIGRNSVPSWGINGVIALVSAVAAVMIEHFLKW